MFRKRQKELCSLSICQHTQDTADQDGHLSLGREALLEFQQRNGLATELSFGVTDTMGLTDRPLPKPQAGLPGMVSPTL